MVKHSDETEVILLLGPAAVGKGEILNRFCSHAECIEMKSLIVSKMESSPEFAVKAIKAISKGELIHDDDVNQLIVERLNKVPHLRTSTIVIDGACRNLVQTQFLRNYLLANHFIPVFMIFSVEDPTEFYELCRDRVMERVLKSTEVRVDDALDTHKKRFDNYLKEIVEIEAYLLRVTESHVHFVDPRKSIDEVFSQIWINVGVGATSQA